MTKAKFAALRKKTGLSMALFGAKLGVDRTTIYRWETGTRGIGKFEAEAIERLVTSLLTETA
jgi:transcriptional regulator with XRE-family HTH domain